MLPKNVIAPSSNYRASSTKVLNHLPSVIVSNRSSNRRLSSTQLLEARVVETDPLTAYFDQFVASLQSNTVAFALEETLQNLLNCTAKSWFVMKNYIYSPSTGQLVKDARGLIRYSHEQDKIILTENPTTLEYYPEQVDMPDNVMLVPFCRANGQKVLVISLESKLPFDDSSFSYATRFKDRFATYSHLIVIDDQFLRLIDIFFDCNDLNIMIQEVQQHFQAQVVDFYSRNPQTGQITKNGSPITNVGVVEQAFNIKIPYYVFDTTKSPFYNSHDDGTLTTFLSVPVFQDIIVLRGLEFSHTTLLKIKMLAVVMENILNVANKGVSLSIEASLYLNDILDFDFLMMGIIKYGNHIFSNPTILYSVVDDIFIEYPKMIEVKNSCLTECIQKKNIIKIGEETLYPIFDKRNDLIAILKVQSNDLKQATSYAQICGIALFNAMHFREIERVTSLMNNSNTTYDTYLEQASKFIKANRITILMYDDDLNQLFVFKSYGQQITNASLFVRDCISQKESIVFDGDQMKNFKQSSDITVESLRSINKVPSINQYDLEHSDAPNVVAIPLFNAEQKIIGAVEIGTKLKIYMEDLKVLETYSRAISIKLQNEGQYVKQSIFIYEDENELFETPSKLIDPNDSFGLDYNSLKLAQGITVYRLIWHAFTRFNVQKLLKIENQHMFHFLCDIQMYQADQWGKTVDSFEYLYYLLQNFDNLKALNLLPLLVAILGYKCEETLSFPMCLLKENGKELIKIISKQESNILSNIEIDVQQGIWIDILDFINALDFRNHNEVMSQYKSNPKDLKNKHKLLLKAAYIGCCTRDYAISTEYSKILFNSFIKSGDKETVESIQKEPNPKIAFFKTICFPIFDEIVKIVKNMDVVYNQFKSHVARWSAST